jgi:hypothetical protein
MSERSVLIHSGVFRLRLNVTGKVNPLSDIETINTELALADLASVDKQLTKYAKAARAGGDREAQRIAVALEKVGVVLNEGRPARTADLYAREQFSDVVGWLALNHGALDVFVHPNTGNQLSDHRDRALWLGRSYQLSLGALPPD